jgi:pyruvate,water dikinase
MKLLPFGALRKFPAVLLHIRRAKKSPAEEHLRSQAKLRRFVDDALRFARNETSLVRLTVTLTGRLIQDVFLNTAPLFILGRMALRQLKETAGEEFTEYFPKLELSLPNNMTTEMGMAISRMAKLLPSGLNADEIRDGIEHATLPQPLLSAWRQFTDDYGCRGPLELDVAAPRYRENPPLVASMLVAARGSSDKDDPLEKFAHNREVRKNAYDAICQGIRKRSADEERRFAAQYETFETFSGYRESHKFYAAFVTDLVRQKILQRARELLAGGRLQSFEPAFDLTLDQLDRAFHDPSLDLVKQAKENRAFADRLARVPRLPTVVDSRGLILRPPAPPMQQGEVVGTPVSAGVVRGRVKILHSPDEKPLAKGEVLVARAIDPGWTPLFVNAGAVILEVGGLLQHGALVAREYGLPCVAGVERATELWNDGDLVEVDGTVGIVRKLRVDPIAGA